MNHIIRVSLVDAGTSDERVRAYPNPLPKFGQIAFGDTVTWLFDPDTVGGRELQVLFTKVYDPDKKKSVATNPLGPLSKISLEVSGIVGTIRLNLYAKSLRFFYRIIENGTALKWYKYQDVEGATETDGGGIDIPMTPQ